MKTPYAWIILTAVAAGAAGLFIGQARVSIKINQRVSSAGQTLLDLSRTLESEKQKTGTYPHSITQLIESSTDESPQNLLRDTIYYKTETGYIAFIGVPHVAYIHPGISTHFK